MYLLDLPLFFSNRATELNYRISSIYFSSIHPSLLQSISIRFTLSAIPKCFLWTLRISWPLVLLLFVFVSSLQMLLQHTLLCMVSAIRLFPPNKFLESSVWLYRMRLTMNMGVCVRLSACVCVWERACSCERTMRRSLCIWWLFHVVWVLRLKTPLDYVHVRILT